MREMGHEDSIVRNYDLLRWNGKGEMHLYLAMRHLNEPVRSAEDARNWLPEIAQRFANMGAPRPDLHVLSNRLRAWYVHNRIEAGTYQQWFLSDMVRAARA